MFTPTFRLRRWPWLASVFLLVLLAGATAVSYALPVNAVLTGHVTDPNGQLPPNGTAVTLHAPDGHEYGHAVVLGDGSFSLGPVPNGNYILQAEALAGSGFSPSFPLFLLVGESPLDVGTLALTYPSVTGTVFAPDGTSPTTAVVQVSKDNVIIANSLALNGQIALGGLLNGVYGVEARPLDSDPYWFSPRETLTITAGISQTLDLTLRPANVVGVVRDPNHVPVGGASVQVFGQHTQAHHTDLSGLDGHFAIGDLPADTYTLLAEPPWQAPGLAASLIYTFTIPPDFTDMGDVVLQNAPKLLQGLVETNTHTPIQNAKVVANRLDHPGHQETLTDNSGHYTLHLSSGFWSVIIDHTDTTTPPNWVYLEPPKIIAFAYNLDPETRFMNFVAQTADSHVTGQVELPGGGTVPFTVTVGLHTPDGNGRSQLLPPNQAAFDIQVPHGNYILTVQPLNPGYFGPEPLPVNAPENGSVNAGTLTLVAKDSAISGHVTDGSGNGIGGVRVVGWTHNHLTSQSHTNPDGSYLLPVANGEWQVRPDVPSDLPWVYLGEPMTATITQTAVITPVDFVLAAARNTVVGQLVDPQGHLVNIPGSAVAGTPNGHPINHAPIAGGAFHLSLPDGDFVVGIHLPPNSEWIVGAPQAVSVHNGETVTLTVPLLHQNASIVGALRDRQGNIVSGVEAEVSAQNPWTTIPGTVNPDNGTYHLNVVAGIWNIFYHVDPASNYVALTHHKTIPVEQGQTVAVGLPVALRDSHFEGVVLDPSGTPLAGAHVSATGIGDVVDRLVLDTISDDNGHFSLAVPHGLYRLRAYSNHPEWLNPQTEGVFAPPAGTVSGITLQFHASNATLSGTVTIPDGPANGRVHIWAYNEHGGSTQTSILLGETYTLPVFQNSDWHVGASLETENSFYHVQTAVHIGAGNQTLDLILEGPFAKPGPVVVTFAANEPQQLQLADGTQIIIPAGAIPVEGDVTLHITPIATLPHQNNARLYKYGYAFIATDADGTPVTQSFNQNVIIRFSYEEAELHRLGLTEEHLQPAYYSTSTQSWTLPNSFVVDTEANQVSLQIDHFTDYTLLNTNPSYQVILPIMIK